MRASELLRQQNEEYEESLRQDMMREEKELQREIKGTRRGRVTTSNHSFVI